MQEVILNAVSVGGEGEGKLCSSNTHHIHPWATCKQISANMSMRWGCTERGKSGGPTVYEKRQPSVAKIANKQWTRFTRISRTPTSQYYARRLTNLLINACMLACMGKDVGPNLLCNPDASTPEHCTQLKRPTSCACFCSKNHSQAKNNL